MSEHVKGRLCRRQHDSGGGTSWRYASGSCVECQQQNSKHRDPIKVAANSRAWRLRHPDRSRDVVARSRVKHAESTAVTARKWRAANKVSLAAKMRKYRAENKEKFRAIESRRVRSPESREKFNAYRREHKRANLDQVQAAYQRRRAALSVNNTLTAAELRAQRDRQNGKCFYCQKPLDNKGQGHIDHLIPLSRGGYNEASNIAIACSSCNLRKARKTSEEFISVLKGRAAVAA